MSRNMITIMKKEFARFFGDKRLVMTTILLPGLMIYVMYSIMGNAMQTQFSTAEDYVYEIHTVNLPDTIKTLMENDTVDIVEDSVDNTEEVKAKIRDKGTDLLIVFPENFAEDILAYDSMTAQEPAPLVEMYYNSVDTESSSAYNRMTAILNQYESGLANKFDINAGQDTAYDLATKEDTTGKIFSMMLPMLMMIFLFSGCMAIAPESIAGEKERGTIATLLVTPMKRSELALGKILSLSVIGLLSGISSFIGTMLSLPNLMGDSGDGELGGMGAAVYSGMDFFLLLLVILSSVLVIVAAISVISGLSKSVKEAGTAVTPLMIVVMVIGITSMFGDGAPKEMFPYMIPLYNSVQCMNGIFSFQMEPVNFAVTIAVNLVAALIMVGGLAKIFDSEKIMYS